MSSVTSHISISLDGFVAGPNQSTKDPLGEGGERLHEWAFRTDAWQREHGREGGEHNADSEVVEETVQNVGAYVMGRKMPVFVLTHHAHEPLPMRGGTTFHFVTEGIESALEQARAAAGDRDVAIAGGASAIRQYLAAGLLDELYLHIVPVVLGAGERLLQDVGDPKLEPLKVVASPAATHVKYRVVH